MRSFLAIADLFSKNIPCDLDRRVNAQLICYLEKKTCDCWVLFCYPQILGWSTRYCV